MRKIFVVLLVLAIAGGALAQEAEDKGTWGTWSGSVDMSTEFNLNRFDPEDPDDLDKKVNGDTHGPSTITGDKGGIELKLQWDYAKDNWTVAVPFVINKDDGVKIDGAKVEYADGPLTVKVPFGVNLGNLITGKTKSKWLDDGSDTHWLELLSAWLSSNPVDPDDEAAFKIFEKKFNEDYDWGKIGAEYQFNEIFKDIHIEAAYETDTYAFGAGMNNIFKDIAAPSDFKAWGWYDFDVLAGARLVVSYGGGYATEWWRASTIVLQGSTTFWDDTAIDTNLRWARTDSKNKYGKGYDGFGNGFSTGGGYDSLLTDNKDKYFDLDDDGFYYTNTGYGYKWGDIADAGLAFKLNIIPELSVGFAFAGTQMFEGAKGKKDAKAPNPDDNNDTQSYGTEWLIGDGFFRNFLFGLGYESDVFSASAMLGFAPATNKKKEPAVDVYVHAGLKVNVMEGLSIGADISMVGYADEKTYIEFDKPGKPKGFKTEENVLGFNMGAEVDFKSDMGLWANLKFAAIDLGNKANFSIDEGRDHFAGSQYNAKMLSNVGMNLGLGFQLGYDMDLSETLALGISAGIVIKDGKNTIAESKPRTGDSKEKDLDYFYLGINPVLTWAVVENGTIEFSYKFGFDTQEEKIKDNKLGIAFAWSF